MSISDKCFIFLSNDNIDNLTKKLKRATDFILLLVVLKFFKISLIIKLLLCPLSFFFMREKITHRIRMFSPLAFKLFLSAGGKYKNQYFPLG